jgi:hypothetical protein
MNSSLVKTIPLLSLSLKYLIRAKEKIIMINIAAVTSNRELGNSVGVRGQIVSNINIPRMIVSSIVNRS